MRGRHRPEYVNRHGDYARGVGFIRLMYGLSVRVPRQNDGRHNIGVRAVVMHGMTWDEFYGVTKPRRVFPRLRLPRFA